MAAIRLEKLVRIQAIARSYIAKNKKKSLKDEKIKGLFRKFQCHSSLSMALILYT